MTTQAIRNLIVLTFLSTWFAGCSHIAPGTQHSIQTKLGQRKYGSYSTDELKLRRNQLVEMLSPNRTEVAIRFGSGLAMALDDDGAREELFKEKNEIERELLRR